MIDPGFKPREGLINELDKITKKGCDLHHHLSSLSIFYNNWRHRHHHFSTFLVWDQCNRIDDEQDLCGPSLFSICLEIRFITLSGTPITRPILES